MRSNADSFYWDRNIAKYIVKRLKEPHTLPFFYGLGFIGPHNPFTPSLKYWNRTGDSSAKEMLPQDSSGTISPHFIGNGSGNIELPSTPPNDRRDVPRFEFFGGQYLPSDSEWRRIIHAYDAEVAQTDAQLGYVLDEIDRQNLWANTVIVFFGDHGQHLGEHEGVWKKNTLFEESLHIPLIICAPGKQGDKKCSKIVELEDIYPTLLELCSLPPLSTLEGSSLVPLLDNSTLIWKRAAFSQLKRILKDGSIVMGRSIRTDQYRYTS